MVQFYARNPNGELCIIDEMWWDRVRQDPRWELLGDVNEENTERLITAEMRQATLDHYNSL